MSIGSYRDLRVWQQAFDLALEVYSRTRAFPSHETYGLRSQLRRAAISIALNVAEGRSRSGTREFLNFLSIAQGSRAETETLIMFSQRLGYLSESDSGDLLEGLRQLEQMIGALQRSLRNRLPKGSRRPNR